MNKPTIDLRQDYLEIVRLILRAHLTNHTVWAFGSRVNGIVKPASDLDLAIMEDIPIDAATLANLREAFSESDLPIKIDLVDFAAASDIFQKIIKEQGVIVEY